MCDTAVVITADRVLFAKNSDRDPNESQLLEWHAPADHHPGSVLRCTHIEIPQVGHTHAVLISRPFWMWGAEMGSNEHGVTIGNEAVFTTEPYAASGLTGMDLVRLALERAASAEQAVDCMVELLERHGQGGGCGLENPSFTYHNSFLIADPGGAFVLETAGRRWATEAVSPGVRTISNGLTIPAFAASYGDRLRGAINRCSVRRAITASMARPDVAPLMALLRSHGDCTWPRYSPISGAMGAPCVHAGGTVASAQTTGSWISELSATSQLHWVTATAAPCTSLFKPARVDEPLAQPALPPTDRADSSSLWWRHERLHRAMLRDPSRARHLGERDALEREWIADPPPSTLAFAHHDERLADWIAAVEGTADRRPWWVRRYWARRNTSAFAGARTDLTTLLARARASLVRVSPQDAEQAARGGACLIDIRSDAQIAADGVIPGALVIARNVLEWRLDPDSGHRHPQAPGIEDQVIIVCDGGHQSSLAAATLKELGFARATDLAGGFQAWRAAGLPVASPPPS